MHGTCIQILHKYIFQPGHYQADITSYKHDDSWNINLSCYFQLWRRTFPQLRQYQSIYIYWDRQQ